MLQLGFIMNLVDCFVDEKDDFIYQFDLGGKTINMQMPFTKRVQGFLDEAIDPDWEFDEVEKSHLTDMAVLWTRDLVPVSITEGERV